MKLSLASSILGFAAAAISDDDKPWLDPTLPTDTRVSALLSSVTTEELISQCVASMRSKSTIVAERSDQY